MAKNKHSPENQPLHITQIKVRDLFGHLSYDLPRIKPESAHDDLLIIYGDNGSGKTTLLRLLFNTLSTKPGGGRKTFLAQTPFRTFEVEFIGGTTVKVEKPGKLIGDYTVTIVEPSGKNEKFTLRASPDGSLKQEGNPFDELLGSLSKLQVSLYFLPDDRRVQADFADDMPEIATQRAGPYRMKKGSARSLLVPTSPLSHERWMFDQAAGGILEESHHLEIEPVLAALVNSLRRQAILGSNAGEGNASSIYLRVVEGLRSVANPGPDAPTLPASQLIQRIEALNVKTAEFSKFGLHARFPADKFIAAVGDASAQQPALQGVLGPYLEGLEARLEAMQELYDIVSTYVETLNSFFANKSIGLDVQRGISVTSRWGESINPDYLSSGERQLLLLLSNTILARKKSSIFIIDEPELSLNVTWQRRLVSALLKCSHGGGIQYILASHSLELITQYHGRTERLVPLHEAVSHG
jgi:energy-coupling factor transporter ATP-binding protein EcfA2